MNKISIITVNLNNKKGLDKTIISVLNQTSQDYELIIIDGGSTDGSLEIINKYEDRIKYWVSETDNGIYPAMNKGIAQSKGDYLIFLNSGDSFYNQSVIENFVANEQNEDIIYGDALLSETTNGIEKLVLRNTKKEINLFHFIRHALPSHQSMFFNKKLFIKYGFYNEKYSVIADADFITRVYFNNPQITIRYIPFIISIFDKNGISNNKKYDKQKYYERKQIYKEYLPLYGYYINRIYQITFFLKKLFGI